MPVDRGQRLAPEHVGVGVPGGDLDGCVGGATEIDRYVRRLARAHRWRGALEAVELAVEIHRSRGGPDSTQGLQVFVGTGVAAVMVEVVAIAREVLVVTTTDYVQGQAALAELIQGSQLACRQRRCNHPRAIGQENAKAPGGSGDEGTDHRALGGIAEIPHQHPVEAGVLMGLGETPDETGVHSLPQRLVHLGTRCGGDHAENFHAHAVALAWAARLIRLAAVVIRKTSAWVLFLEATG